MQQQQQQVQSGSSPQRPPIPPIDLAALNDHFEAAVSKLFDPQTRVQGEQLLQDFRRLPNLEVACRYILDHARTSTAQFHAALALQNALPRIYNQQSPEERISLRQYLLQYILQRCSALAPYVLTKISLTAALIIKLGYLRDTNEANDQLIGSIIQLLTNSDWHQRYSGLQLLIGILDEFSSTKATAIGLPYDFHRNCQAAFERSHLQIVFEAILRSTQNELCDRQFLATADGRKMIDNNLFCAEKILSWSCIAGKLSSLPLPLQDSTNATDGNGCSSPKFPAAWGSVLLVPSVVDLFFEIAVSFFREPSIASKSHRCIIQLAGLQGDVLAAEDSKLAYASHLMRNSTKHLSFLLQSIAHDAPSNAGEVLLDMSQIGRQLLTNFKITILLRIPDARPFLQDLGHLTLLCIRNMAEESDDTWSLDTVDELLSMWSSLVQDLEILLQDESMCASSQGSLQSVVDMRSFISTTTDQIFCTYIDVRMQLAKQNIEEEEDEDGNSHFKDLDVYSDQLIYIASIGRVNSEKCLSQLGQLLTEYHAKLSQLYENFQDSNQPEVALLSEQIHWLTLIAGHVLADSADGEKPLIPTSLQQLSTHIYTSGNDPCVALPTCIFNILDLVTVDPKSPMHAVTSPLVVETLLWFVERWGCTYLFVDPSDYKNLSPSFVNAFGKAGGAPQATEFLLDKIQRNFVAWHADLDVVGQIISVLEGLSGNKDTRDAFLHSATFNGVVQFFLANLNRFPSTLHSTLIQTIAYIFTHSTGADRVSYFTNLTSAIENMLLGAVHQPSFSSLYQSPEIQEQVVSAMEMYDGLALAADGSNMIIIFETCARQFPVFVKLLDLYHSYPDVEFYILQFFCDLVKYQALDTLQPHHYEVLYRSILELIQIYAKNEVGRKRGRGRGNEESELNTDLSMLLEMLTGLITSEYEGLDRADVVHLLRKSAASSSVDVVKVVFFGVNSLIPLVTEDMLSYSRLCRSYINVVTYLVEYFPNQLVLLPADLISSLFKSLVYGLNQPISSLSISALRAMESISLFLWSEQTLAASSNPAALISTQYDGPLNEQLDTLLQQTLECVLFKAFDPSLTNAAADAISALVIIRRQSFEHIARGIIQSQASSFSSRLTNAFSSLSRATVTFDTYQRSQVLSGKFLVGYGCGNMYSDPQNNARTNEQRILREEFSKFLLNVRGLLLVK
ncbi:hypothetical protein BASA50_009139 [Batrachochytrium salamandrivorans]|uniref:Exportin-4 n=1 Tax=Batrachochytrium salamandrivorans TaxID=1357716 RepID=A0ABQ8F2X7_9FUNG|nr:hypothetical protein BASA61_010418 [Batrachochytrium salamandrivorans]KAH6591136.1 hypothetical protein BASA50_009139 [Batrachochytrium salamandrivorans]KAH9268658.1 hypothetical protein BASA84_000086 [Batrachochytrium salamandrivorans]KAH9277410.1 hypothetical protein BASA83_000281 [Batrachochytrium salamandrivorans]